MFDLALVLTPDSDYVAAAICNEVADTSFDTYDAGASAGTDDQVDAVADMLVW